MMRNSLLVAFLAALCAPLWLAGGEPDHPLSLEEALGILRANNPNLGAGRSQVKAVGANEITANLRPNPIFISANQDFNIFNPSEFDIVNGQEFTQGVNQTIERGGKRAARLESARWSTRLAEKGYEDTERQLEFAVKSAFVTVLHAKSNLQLAQDSLQDYKETVRVNEIRLKAGDISATEFQRIQVEQSSFERDVLDAQMALTQARIQLASLLGIPKVPENFDVAGELTAPELAVTLDDLQAMALDHRPDYLAAQDGVKKAEADVRLARANGATDITVGGEFKRNGPDNTVGFTVSFPLRFFDRNQGEKARSRFQLESSQYSAVAAKTSVSADVAQAFDAYRMALARAKLYSGDHIGQAKEVRDRMQFSYRNGGATILDYLDAIRRYRELELARRASFAQVMNAVHQLSFVTGTEIKP
jgi:outer membrane protein, heavy metal efflux system